MESSHRVEVKCFTVPERPTTGECRCNIMTKTFTVRLTGPVEQEYKALKVKFGLKADVEVVRHMIHKTAISEGLITC